MRIIPFLLFCLSITAASAQAIGGNASISANGTSANVALPANTQPYPAVIIAPAAGVTTEIFYALGNASVEAIATQSPSLPPNGICLNVGSNNYVAAITGGTAASVRITQMSACPPF